MVGWVGAKIVVLTEDLVKLNDLDLIMTAPFESPDDFESRVAKMMEEKMARLAKMLDEDYKIVVWWKDADGKVQDEYACGDTPEEVVNFMRSRSWIEEENKDSQKYMSGVQSRNLLGENFLFYDEESFLHGLVKIGNLHIQKWDWEP